MNISDDPTRMEQPDEPGGGSLRPGQTFGQYKVIGLLGRGGMGEVYRVRHEVLEREYALKLIHPEVLESRDALQRFQDEARVMAKLDHPHIVKVDDFGTTEGRHWLRMELVEEGGSREEGRGAGSSPRRSTSFPLRQDSGGQDEGSPSAAADSERESTDRALFSGASLGEYVRAHDGRLPESQVRDILRQILDGLGYAHRKGLVHRDIKPANILLAARASDDEGRMADGEDHASAKVPQVKIADFGLVRVAGEDWLRSQVEKSVAHSTSSHRHAQGLTSGQAQSMSISEQATRVLDSGSGSQGTSTRALLGTYAYMSPEQKRGEDVDSRSDLYAVGLMAYQMLTGQETIGMKAPSRLNPEIDPSWDEWVEKAIELEKAERFSSAEEMLSALNELPVGVPPLDGSSFISRGSKGKRPPKGGTLTRQITPRKRRPLLTTLSILFILALLGIGAWKGYDWWVREQARTAEQLASEREAAQLEAEQQERLAAGRAEFERLLGTGNLEEAGGVLASLEEDGFSVADLRLALESQASARETRRRAGRAEVERKRWEVLIAEDGEGLEGLLSELESSWRSAERASADGIWGEALSGYDRVLERSRRLERLASERDAARERRLAMRRAKEEAADLDASRQAAEAWNLGVELEQEGDNLYAGSVYTEAAEKWEEATKTFTEARERLQGIAWKEAKVDWEKALAEVDKALLEEWAGEEWEAALTKASEGERSREDPEAGKASYEAAVTLLTKSRSVAEEKSSPAVRVRVYLEGKETEGIAVSLNGKEVKSGERIDLERGTDRLLAEVAAFERGGVLYEAGQVESAVDWLGLKALELRLEAAQGPVPGFDTTVNLPGGVELEMVWIEPGEFMMGSPSDEKGRSSFEGPQTRVRISRGYWLGRYPVTQGQWAALMDTVVEDQRNKVNRELSRELSLRGEGQNYPIYYVSWTEAMEFARKLTEQELKAGQLPEGYGYTLPSEAQWEYACRAGTTTRWSFGDDESRMGDHAWYSGNAGGMTRPVGQKRANPWGLHDMHGNVSEWTRSWFGSYPGGSVKDYDGPTLGTDRVLRGGPWRDSAPSSGSASRSGYPPGFRYHTLGFRIALAPLHQKITHGNFSF